ncbi:unnamed protein product [Aphanomyces euteiches]
MFPPREVGEDFLEFRIYFDEPVENEADERVKKMQEQVDLILHDYIWQKEPLVLHKSPSVPLEIHGKMLVGDNVEDEWVATAALLKLTKTNGDITVKVWDADGEFLLIEAAEALPSWLHPENSANRVFLRRGHVHIVQQNIQERQLDLKTALLCVIDPNVSTRASPALDAIVLDRLSVAQTHSMETNRHVIQCRLPHDAAVVFQALPHCIAYAVEAFYYREPTESTRICRLMDKFPPQAKRYVTTMIPLTRCMYAQVKQQQFAPPKPFQPFMPPADDPSFSSAEMGMKLTCGLELLCESRMKNHQDIAWADLIDGVLREEKTFDPVPLRPDDDDSWLYVSPEGLESMLAQAESKLKQVDNAGAETGGEELQSMATLFNNFVHEMSDYEGVAKDPLTADEVSFDMDSLLNILKGEQVAGMGATEPSVDDYVYESDDDEEEDTYDDHEDAAMDEMMREMDEELAQSNLAKSFARPDDMLGDGSAATTKSSDPIKPVDVDFNLVANLLESFAAQEGVAGPVSNMLRDMGFASRDIESK